MSSSIRSFEELLGACNHTELHQICRRMDIHVRPTASREDMIDYICGNDEPPPPWHGINAWRHALMGFVLDNWELIRSQISCPAKSGDPRACFGCTDTQVMFCVVDNHDNESLIQLHKKDQP